MPTADGVEVRLTVDFPYFCVQEKQGGVVRNVTLAEDSGACEANRPSIVLRLMQSGESLWEVAKRYRTSPDVLSRENALTDRDGAQRVLFVPVLK